MDVLNHAVVLPLSILSDMVTQEELMDMRIEHISHGVRCVNAAMILLIKAIVIMEAVVLQYANDGTVLKTF